MQSNGTEDDITKLFDDAVFDCYRARHDAIDAATAKIAIDLEIKIEKLGYEAILPPYPNFPKLVKELNLIREKIIQSRGQRHNREQIYSVLESADFPALVKSFTELNEVEAIMMAIARSNRRVVFLGKASIWIAIAALVAGVALPSYFWLHP